MIDREQLRKILRTINVNQNPYQLLKKYTYPYGLKEFTNQILIDHMKTLSKWEEKDKFNRRVSFDENFFKELALKFQSGLELLENSNSPTEINPILAYYGINQIYSAIIDITFENVYHSRGHGIKNYPKYENNILNWTLRLVLTRDGFFRKLAIILHYFESNSELVDRFFFKSLYEEDKVKLSKGIILDQGSKWIDIDLIKLNDNYWSNLSYLRSYNRSDQILFRYLNLFAFCSTLRYNPKIWLKFKDGTSQMFKTYKDLASKIIFDVLWLLEKVKYQYANPVYDIEELEKKLSLPW